MLPAKSHGGPVRIPRSVAHASGTSAQDAYKVSRIPQREAHGTPISVLGTG